METYWRVTRGRLTLPPLCEDEWEPSDVQEAAGGAKGRRDAALAAAKDVRRDKFGLERDAVTSTRNRLLVLKRELQGILVDASATDFRRFQAQQLLATVDEALSRATRSLQDIAHASYKSAAALGGSQIDEAIQAARLAMIATPTASGLSSTLVNASFQNTVDLLSDAMSQFRTRVRLQVRRLASTGANFSQETQTLAQHIDDAGFASADYAAEKILRTELSRTFNGSTYDRLDEMAQRLPFIRKVWIRVNDNRTRDTHVAAAAAYARGRGILVPERFAVGAATLLFPGDPNAEPSGKIAARETIQCRCSLAVDFDLADLEQATTSRLTLAFGA